MSDQQIPHFNVNSADWKPLPEFGGHEAVLYRSPDGRRVAATFKESGQFEFEWAFDEMIYVVAGTIEVTPEGGELVTLTAGDMAYMRKGIKASMVASDDYQGVICMMSEEEISWR